MREHFPIPKMLQTNLESVSAKQVDDTRVMSAQSQSKNLSLCWAAWRKFEIQVDQGILKLRHIIPMLWAAAQCPGLRTLSLSSSIRVSPDQLILGGLVISGYA